jgi:DNA-binding CsgD family transcriptional regulator
LDTNPTNFFDEKLLTKRGKEIIILITKEKTVDEISEVLLISRLRVETHKKNIFLKLGIETNAGFVKKAIILELI